ncbi:MAG: winged helix-turn-helix transcriptional regulator [Candidatus Thorarchaeota archaeon]|jgi:DNA-binding MarR family transcriptional regulator
MGRWGRKLVIATTLTLMMTGLVSLFLFSPNYSGSDLAVQDLSFSDSSGITLLDLHILVAPVSSGTSVLFPGLLANSFTPTSIFTLFVGTVSTARKSAGQSVTLRERVVDEIAANPGIHLRELHRSLGCAMGALQYHLKHLEKDGLVSSLRNGNSRHFYSQDITPDEEIMRLMALARNPTIASILDEVLTKGRVTQAELSRTLLLDKSLISYYVSSLLKADVLNTVRVFGRERPVIMSSWASSVLLKLALV